MKKLLALLLAAVMVASCATASANSLLDLLPSGEDVAEAVDQVKEKAGSLLDLLPSFDEIKDAAGQLVEDVKETAGELVDSAKDAVGDLVDNLTSGAEELAGAAEEAAAGAEETVADVAEEVTEAAEELAGEVAGAAEEAAEEVTEAAEETAEAAEEAAEEAPAGALAYLMYADGTWTNQYWGGDAEGNVTPGNAEIAGPGSYSVAIEFAEPAAGLAFAAVGIKDGENLYPNYTIEITAIRVNDQEIAFEKGYTSSDDGVETRMNIYNEWVSELPADARSFDGSVDGAAPIIVDKAAFEAVTKVEVDFVLHQYMQDTAYLMFADGSWAKQYWYDGNEYPVTAQNAVIDGFGDYTVGLEFPEAAEGLAFAAVGIANGEKTYPGAFIAINAIRVNGEEIEFEKGYTSSDDGVTTRMNIYNEWVSELPADARCADGVIDDAAPIIVDKAAFTGVTKVEVDFSLLPVTDTAYIMYADGAWAKQYWFADAEGVWPTNALIDGPGTYTVALEFDEPAVDLAFAAVGVATGEQTYNGYFIDIKEIKVNDQPIAVGKGYTSSDDGVTTRENIFNEWVAELPADARRADGDLEGASAIIVDKADFAEVSKIEITFDYIYGKPIVKDENAPLTQEEADELLKADYNAYFACQTENYIFRNAWNDTYGRDDADHEGYFARLTGWDGDNAVDYGGTFTDAVLTADGEYTVSLTTGEMGFGTDGFFRLLFVSTDIPSKLVADGFLTIDNVRVKIGDAATRDYTDIDTTGDFARIVIIDQYNRSEDPFGYTMPGADTKIDISFNVTGLAE